MTTRSARAAPGPAAGPRDRHARRSSPAPLAWAPSAVRLLALRERESATALQRHIIGDGSKEEIRRHFVSTCTEDVVVEMPARPLDPRCTAVRRIEGRRKAIRRAVHDWRILRVLRPLLRRGELAAALQWIQVPHGGGLSVIRQRLTGDFGEQRFSSELTTVTRFREDGRACHGVGLLESVAAPLHAGISVGTWIHDLANPSPAASDDGLVQGYTIPGSSLWIDAAEADGPWYIWSAV